MKHSIILAGLVLGSLFTSCQDDYLDAPAKSTLEESVIFSDPTLAEGAIDGIKVPFGETNSYRGRYLPYYGLNTDTEWFNAASTLDDKSALTNYTATSTNDQMNTDNNVWAMMYQGIERANLSVRGLRTYGNPKPGTPLGYLLGEALTLRAIYYADLVKTWGDVPFRFEPISSSTLYLPKSPRAEVYKQLLKDLAEAETLVPWPNETAATSSVERINKAFVKAFRARIAMAAAGYQQYPDGIHRSPDPELSVEKMYKLALDECRSVIESGKARLEPTFEGFWKKYNQENLAAGGESLWEIPFGDGRGRMLFTFAVRHTDSDQYHANGANRGGTAGPLPFVFYDYDQADTRRDVTCVPYKWSKPVNGVAKQELGAIDTWYFGKYRYEWMSRFVTSTNDDGVNKIYMRYAEVLLIAAEAANELEGPAAAAPYLKQVRSRAFSAADQSAKVDAYISDLTSKEKMFQAIVDENKYEFTGEMERKQALIRWNLLGKNMAEAKEKMIALKNGAAPYENVPTKLYFKYKDDATGKYPGTILEIYGLNRGETTDPGAGYENITWVWPNKDNAAKDKSNFLFMGDPDAKQFWPIWKVFIDRSNGQLFNDYGYSN